MFLKLVLYTTFVFSWYSSGLFGLCESEKKIFNNECGGRDLDAWNFFCDQVTSRMFFKILLKYGRREIEKIIFGTEIKREQSIFEAKYL